MFWSICDHILPVVDENQNIYPLEALTATFTNSSTLSLAGVEGDTDALIDALGLPDADAEGLREAEGESDVLADGEWQAEGESDCEALGDTEDEGLKDAEGEVMSDILLNFWRTLVNPGVECRSSPTHL